jgi:hypothetical protein
MNFFRQQEVRLAIRFLRAHYQRQGRLVPGEQEVERQATKIVDDAHRIARERGRNVISILRELVSDLRK